MGKKRNSYPTEKRATKGEEEGRGPGLGDVAEQTTTPGYGKRGARNGRRPRVIVEARTGHKKTMGGTGSSPGGREGFRRGAGRVPYSPTKQSFLGMSSSTSSHSHRAASGSSPARKRPNLAPSSAISCTIAIRGQRLLHLHHTINITHMNAPISQVTTASN